MCVCMYVSFTVGLKSEASNLYACVAVGLTDAYSTCTGTQHSLSGAYVLARFEIWQFEQHFIMCTKHRCGDHQLACSVRGQDG